MDNESLKKREHISKLLSNLIDAKREFSSKGQEMLPASRVPVIVIINRKINECISILNRIDM